MGFFDSLRNKHKRNAVSVGSEQARTTVGKTHSREFKVAGVTFENRQSSLKKLSALRAKGKVLDVGMEQYDFNGKPAIKITVNGLDVGTLHSKDTEYILKNQEYIKGITDFYIGTFADENNKTVYYAKVKVLFNNKT